MINSTGIGYAEYCSSEMFNVTCDVNHVIMMTSAWFGRYQKGRCIEINLGYLGCGSNALKVMDEKCTGKRWQLKFLHNHVLLDIVDLKRNILSARFTQKCDS